MSGNDVSTAETAHSDQYLPTAHQYIHHYKSPQQPAHQQHLQQQPPCILHTPLLQHRQLQQQQQPPAGPTHQQHQLQSHQHQQQHQQQQQQQQPHHHLNNTGGGVWLPYNSGEFEDLHWPPQSKLSNCNNNNSGGCSGGGGGVGGKRFITPADIPPPPPHPPNSIAGSKRYQTAAGGRHQHPHAHPHLHQQQQQQQQLHHQLPPLQRSRCQCDHPIEIVQASSSSSQPQQQQQQQQQQQPQHHPSSHTHNHSQAAALPPHSLHHRPHNYPHDHLAPRDHILHTQYHKNHHRNSDQLQAPNKPPDSQRMKNLVYSQMKVRRLRIILGVVFGLVILALLATALTFIIKSSDLDNSTNQTTPDGIHLEDVLTGQLFSRRFNGTWSTGTNLIYKENNSIVEYDVKAKRKTTLMFDEHQQYVSYEKSADGQLLLLAKNYKKIFRHSFEADYDIYNITSGQIQPLNIKGDQKSIIMAQWAPVGNGLIINFERNLYYKPSAFAVEIAITDDENPAILNGIPDWVYEEEVFSSNSATWFNPNGTMIAFIRFDDSPTHVINFPYYGEAGDLRYQYPINHLVAYPKAGSSNPRVSLFTVDLVRAAQGLEHLTEIPVPSALNTETDYIITVVEWLNNDLVLSVWMNRIQNLAYLQVFDGLKRYEIYNMESKTGWVDLYSSPFKNRDGTRIALILPQLQDDEGYYRHLCTLSTSAAKSNPEVLTKGKYVVQSILHWSVENDLIFYTANTEPKSEILHVYAIRAAPGHSPKCLTCKLQMSGDVEQTYYSADFNNDHQIVISSLGPGIPIHAIYEWSYSGNQASVSKLLDWETNEHLRSKVKDLAMPTIEIHTIPIASAFTAKVLLQLPPNLDRSGKTKYPMLVDVYGGPDSYSVVNKWILDWGTYLSSNQSVIYAKIDGRGSGLRGEKLLHSIYLKLGTVEITDQIEVAKQLQQKFSFIDANHTGIWGWSYGGYAAAMALANDVDSVFSCAASIAPVTDWAYYDSIYTERYMSLPKLNEIGYANSRLSTRAQKLRGKKFLLVHGTLDDNVHYQQAMILAKNLERNDILFKQISYPDEDHGLAGVRPHLYHSLDRFFGECFASPRLMGSKRK